MLKNSHREEYKSRTIKGGSRKLPSAADAIKLRRQSMVEGIRSQYKGLHESIRKIDASAAIYQAAAVMGFQAIGVPGSVYDYTWPDTITLDTGDPKQFRAVHELFGKLQTGSREPINSEIKKQGKPKQVCWQYLRPVNEDLSHWKFRYRRTLTSKDKCKVVRKRDKSSSYCTVVCEV